MKFSEILVESRVDEFKSKFGKKFTTPQLGKIIDGINPKFLDWVGKNLETINFEYDFIRLTEYLKQFEKISSNLPQTDINSYKSIYELEEALKNYSNKEKRGYKSVQGGNLVFENDRFYVVNPLTHEASCYYGKGTKWCTSTTDSDSNFSKYNSDGKLFYIVDKKLKTDDPYYKVALLYKFDKGKSWWDARDTTFSKGWMIDTPELEEVLNSIEVYMNNEFAEQIKIWNDKELRLKEIKRLEILRVQQRQRRLNDEAEDRRADGEWELGPNIDETGLKAHALLRWLEDVGDLEIQTSQDKVRLSELDEKLNELSDTKTRLENNGEDTQEVDFEIEEVENEIDEIGNKLDVYNIIPTGGFYDLQEFEIVGSPNLEGRRYAVGTSDDMRSSAEDSLRSQIDDMGVSAFNPSFAKNHLDIEKIEQYAKDIFDDDVYNNPEVYFDDSERELSDEQEQKIEILENKIEKAESSIELLEDFEDSQEKIQELEDYIDDWQQDIESIKSNPEGDFPTEIVDEKVQELVDDAINDPESFLNNMGLDWENFVDVDELIEDAIDTDGEAHFLNSYDGSSDEIDVEGTLFYVMRID